VISMYTWMKVATKKLNGANFIQIVDNLQNTDWESSLKESIKVFAGGVPLHSNLLDTYCEDVKGNCICPVAKKLYRNLVSQSPRAKDQDGRET